MGKKLIFILLAVLSACNSALQFDFPANEKIVSCQCLFTPDEFWKVNVAYTFPFGSHPSDNAIGDATVFIIDEMNDTIRLTHAKDGEYRSLSQKPSEGVTYRLTVIANGDTITSSPSRIPGGVDVTVTGLDENPGTIKIDYYTSDDMYALYCNFSMKDSALQGLMVRAYLFDSLQGIDMFTFTPEVLGKIYTQTGDTSVVNHLSSLRGDTIYGYENMDVILHRLLGSDSPQSLLVQIKETAYCGKTFEIIPEALHKILCFTGNSDFISTTYEKRALLGRFNASKPFTVYLLGGYEGAYWVEFNLLSPEAYLFYEGYIAQLNNRIDYNAIQNPVYSNISSGAGIFAGMKRKQIRVK